MGGNYLYLVRVVYIVDMKQEVKNQIQQSNHILLSRFPSSNLINQKTFLKYFVYLINNLCLKEQFPQL